MDAKFFRKNRGKVIKNLEKDSLLILFAGKAPHCSADEYYPFVPNKNFYYLTGVEEEKIILLVEKQGNAVTETLFIQRPNPDIERWLGKFMTKEEAESRSGIKKIMLLEEFDSHFAQLLNSHNFRFLCLDLFKNNIDDAGGPAHIFADSSQKEYPQLTIINIYHQIRDLRMIKQPEEIRLIKKALAITKAGIKNIFSHARSNIMEYEIEAYFNFSLKTNGNFKNAFPSIVASGKNAAVLHYFSNNSPVKPGSLVLLDLGAAFNYYNSDISRTFPIDRRFTKRKKKLYSIVLKAQQAVINIIRPGLAFKDLDKEAKKVLAKECKKIGLIKNDEELSRYYYHNVSHFLGLDTHDVGDRDCILKKGMVLTVEPGLYIEEEEIGIRIEDDVLVTKNGCKNLSADIIKQPEEIERLLMFRGLL